MIVRGLHVSHPGTYLKNKEFGQRICLVAENGPRALEQQVSS